MSKDNKTLTSLVDNIQKEIAWRLKEISVLKSHIPIEKNDKQVAFIRAGIPLLYAHWEGFVKNSADYYIQHVALQDYKYSDLKPCFLLLGHKKYFNEILKSNKISCQLDNLERMLIAINKKSKIPYRNITKTNANLNTALFKDICLTINIDYNNYEKCFPDFDNIINNKLLFNRNNIAHGKNVAINYQDYTVVNDQVVAILNKVKNDVINSASTKQFLK